MKSKTPESLKPPDNAAAFRELAGLYAEADARIAAVGAVCINRGACCDFDVVDHVLYATSLEVDYLVQTHGPPVRWERANKCPYQVDGVCTARDARPLGCRTYYCDPTGAERLHAIHERYYTAVKEIIARGGLSFVYAPMLEQLARQTETVRRWGTLSRRDTGERALTSKD